jgi:hypothetical protein
MSAHKSTALHALGVNSCPALSATSLQPLKMDDAAPKLPNLLELVVHAELHADRAVPQLTLLEPSAILS